MGRRLSFVIGMALAFIGSALAAETVAANPDDAPATTPAPVSTHGVDKLPDLPESPPEVAAKPVEAEKAIPKARIKFPQLAATAKTKPQPTKSAPTASPAQSNLGPEPPTAGPATSLPSGPPTATESTPPSRVAVTEQPAVGVLIPENAPASKLESAPVAEIPAQPPLPPPSAVGDPPPASFPELTAEPRDPKVERVQAATKPAATPTPVMSIEDGKALPPAATPPGQAAGTPSTSAAQTSDQAYVLPPERLPIGKQNIGLTVEVIAPSVININQKAVLKIVVKNNGTTDALGVVVRDELKSTLAYVDSKPEAQRIDALLTWSLGTVPSGAERMILLTVKPTKVGSFDHAATVTMMGGSRSTTLVREPKLKVEQTVSAAKYLKGQPVSFSIVVWNPGDGPVRNVKIQAKLSPGLKHESGEPNDQNLFEQTLDLINPLERVTIDPLVADTILGGEQSCYVVVKSDDVVFDPAEASNLKKIEVVEPKLTMTVTGPDKRYTDTVAKYTLSLENPGTAPARNVRIQATLPVSAQVLAPLPAGAKWDSQTRRLRWARSQIEPGEKPVLSFEVKMGGAGQYQIAAEARADGALLATDMKSTEVEGMADVRIVVDETRRVIDVGDSTVFRIRIVNKGTKEATRLIVKAKLSENLVPTNISGVDKDGGAVLENGVYTPIFPEIPRLGPGNQIELGIRIKAVKAGPSYCRVSLLHDELNKGVDELEDSAVLKITPTHR